MKKKSICSSCKTGAILYKIDPLAPECPYMTQCDGKQCARFVALKKKSLFNRIYQKMRHS